MWIVPGKIRVASVFFALIVAAVVTTAVVMGDVQRKERAVQEHLAEEVLRFHVLANSDSRTDQAVKMEVRDAVLSYLKEVLPEELDVKETTRWMRGHTEEIRQVAEQKMADLQMQQTVSVAVTTCYFPDRTYVQPDESYSTSVSFPDNFQKIHLLAWTYTSITYHFFLVL